jgi:hypothetical protein
MGETSGLDFKGVTVYLGLLRSREFAEMGRERRDAIQGFWIRYFQSVGGQPKFTADGPGFLFTSFDTAQAHSNYLKVASANDGKSTNLLVMWPMWCSRPPIRLPGR